MNHTSEIHLPEKPRYGSPCNHCGQCCTQSLCHAAEIALPGAAAPCPALKIENGKALCGLLLIEQRFGLGPVLEKTLGIGCGCSLPDDGTTDDEIEVFDQRSHERVFGDPPK